MGEFAYLEFSTALLEGGASRYLRGDVNGDGNVDITDINILINIVLGIDSADNYDGRAYINDDSSVDISDVNLAISLMLNIAI